MTEQTTAPDPVLTAELLKVATAAAEGWAIANRDTEMAARGVVAGVVETAVMHLLEEGLLAPVPDLAARLAGPVRLDRRAPAGPAFLEARDANGLERVVVCGAATAGVEEGRLLMIANPGQPFRMAPDVVIYPTDGLERINGMWWRIYRPAIRA